MKYENKELRHEIKYFINNHEYLYLRNRLKESLLVDKFSDENNSYHIRSLYFDDIDETAYRQKEAGVQFRRKYRIRIYNLDSKVIKLERKNKFDNYINKEVASLSQEEFYKILRGDYEFLKFKENSLHKEFYFECVGRLLRPRIIVDYDREAYTLPAGNVRITFDKSLRAGINSFDIFSDKVITKNAIEDSTMIMEVKYDSFLPSHVRNLLQVTSAYRQAASKYVLCTDIIKRFKQ